MNNAVSALTAFLGGIITLTVFSVALSPRAQSASVITAGGNAVANVVGAAVSPITGQNVSVNTGGGSSGGNFGSGNNDSVFSNAANILNTALDFI